jgi:hypothetical protein
MRGSTELTGNEEEHALEVYKSSIVIDCSRQLTLSVSASETAEVTQPSKSIYLIVVAVFVLAATIRP